MCSTIDIQLMLMLFCSFEGKACDGANVPVVGGWNNVFNSCYFSLLVQYAIWRRISSKLAVKIYPIFTFVHTVCIITLGCKLVLIVIYKNKIFLLVHCLSSY